ncbi:NitT/TauT family transport system ATP-binding protein [Actinoalloteichus hoggarensis]|uniref:Bicarbonate transport ATP-binding protein CmpC n=1 Tax=Actinoalloteichus hoggarensis TaxID=1470176 RepID=A0A221W895_9PSEU|nr:ATP-binding cassette domain-containing protein [Actinoalloteichus hoggarensis]ASO22125.1 Bicarbonate transport ATP-binding protein CmpC [Actinoalloteichus hoggarensis]MBB5923794.1 NitT/TauT family transport system ATP-binding protein [Actinoalloteichus hoggarensis]
MTVTLTDEADVDTRGRPAVSVSNVVKRFGHGPDAVVALDGVDLIVRPGEFVCLLGASGCGKTTLLNLLAGLDRPTSGTVTVDAARPAVMFQEPALMPWLTARRNVELPLRLAGMRAAERRRRAADLLELVRLGGQGDKRPHELSGGMRQRVALARALASTGHAPDAAARQVTERAAASSTGDVAGLPAGEAAAGRRREPADGRRDGVARRRVRPAAAASGSGEADATTPAALHPPRPAARPSPDSAHRLLLMDEPFGALDAITRDVLQAELLRVWHATGTSVLFVTHDVREAVRLAQRVVLLSSRPGRVVQQWSSDGGTALVEEITDRLREVISSHAGA